jgi:hypothetical protein
MTNFDRLPGGVKRAIYQTAKAIDMGEIPLVIADEPAQWKYLQALPSSLSGTVIYASASDAPTQVLEQVGSAGYLFLVLDDEMSPDLSDLVRYYLSTRDVLDGNDQPLERRFGPNRINPQHRLVLVCDRAGSQHLGPWIRARVTTIAVLVADP